MVVRLGSRVRGPRLAFGPDGWFDPSLKPSKRRMETAGVKERGAGADDSFAADPTMPLAFENEAYSFGPSSRKLPVAEAPGRLPGQTGSRGTER